MPLKRCMINGKAGWKWGDEGKCYTGPNAKRMAMEQAAAIKASGYKEENSDVKERGGNV